MGVYIEHMKIPERCTVCRFSDKQSADIYCMFDGILTQKGVIKMGQASIKGDKPEWCPLVEVEHGKV